MYGVNFHMSSRVIRMCLHHTRTGANGPSDAERRFAMKTLLHFDVGIGQHLVVWNSRALCE
jgi:hypothetical protein